MNRSIALLPSMQRNQGADCYVEGEAMLVIGEHAARLLSSTPGYAVEVFWLGLESDPDLPLLRRQQALAELWLRAQPGSYEDKLALNFHTDSSATPHVYALYGRGKPNEDAAHGLAAALVRPVARAMKTRTFEVLTERGSVDYSQHLFAAGQFFTSVLLECGGHRSARDVRLLCDTPEAIARGFLLGIERYFGDREGGKRVTWQRGLFEVRTQGAVARSAPSRSGRPLRRLGPAVLVTDGFTEGGQRVAGSSRWYHLAAESGYGWVHSSTGRYREGIRDE